MVEPRSQYTLMAVHAHPDDEASSTGGIFARYASEGVQTVLVTCTNGELGDMPSGEKPGEPGHDEAVVVSTRRYELQASGAILGIDHVEMLGFRDSGMMGWPQNEAPGAFWNVPVSEGAQRLLTLIEKYRPQVVVTYDANGFYGHPDHIQAHRITIEACSSSRIPEKVYTTALPKSLLPAFAEIFESSGVEPPDLDEIDFGTPDELIAAKIDCSAFTEKKFAALEAHRSQTENEFFVKLNRDAFARVFAVEYFVRAYDRTNAPVPELDLFAGVAPNS